jgi:hypothetical protein
MSENERKENDMDSTPMRERRFMLHLSRGSRFGIEVAVSPWQLRLTRRQVTLWHHGIPAQVFGKYLFWVNPKLVDERGFDRW